MQNKYFQELSPAQKRVAIAKDVIAQVKMKKIVGKEGSYIIFEGKELVFEDNFEVPLKQDCEACAVGSVFLSMCRLTGKKNHEVKEWDEDYDNRKSFAFKAFKRSLMPYFSIIQLSMIEAAFEKEFTDYNHKQGVSERPIDIELLSASKNFGQEIQDDTERLVTIMKNIVDNKGCFIPFEKEKASCAC
jgi:hypothetical protein